MEFGDKSNSPKLTGPLTDENIDISFKTIKYSIVFTLKII